MPASTRREGGREGEREGERDLGTRLSDGRHWLAGTGYVWGVSLSTDLFMHVYDLYGIYIW